MTRRFTTNQKTVLYVLEELQSAEKFVPIDALAAATGKHRRTVVGILTRIRAAGLELWQGRRIETRRGRGGGIRLAGKRKLTIPRSESTCTWFGPGERARLLARTPLADQNTRLQLPRESARKALE